MIYYDKKIWSEKYVLEQLVALLDEADIVIAHYGDKFDLPTIRTRCIVHGLELPSPYKTIDTKKVASKEFNFPLNSLEYLADALDLPIRKGKHREFPGFELWLGVMRDDPKAWAEMQAYNVDDILVLESLYLRLRPYITNHPNVGVLAEDGRVVCPKCGSASIQYRGYATTQTGKYKRFRCNGCGGWGRHRSTVYPVDKRKALAVNVVK